MDTLDQRRTKPAESNTLHPLRETASQTAGPYVHIGCAPAQAGLDTLFDCESLPVQSTDQGNPINIYGHVFDGANEPCKDIMLEFWHCDANGSHTPGVWQRTMANPETGLFAIRTTMPGIQVLENGNKMAPFINIWLAARGINTGLLTRMYFPEFPDLNQNDPHFRRIETSRKPTLIATLGQTQSNYTFDIRLQGGDETVFFKT